MISLRRMSVPALALAAITFTAGCGDEPDARAAPTTPGTSAGAVASVARLQTLVRARVAEGRSTGIVAGLVLPDGTTRVVAAGPERRGRPLDAESVLEIGSITKVFTGTLLADMAARGEVRVTDPVASLLPTGVEVPAVGGRQITLQDLARQVSGLPGLPSDFRPKDPGNPYAGYSVEQMYAFLGSHRLRRRPGASYEYSNLGVGLLGHALALRAGRSYEALVRERILGPLGMARSGVTLTGDAAARFADGHGAGGDVVPHWDLPTFAGSGALRASMADMLRFAAANLEDDGTLQQAMTAARTPARDIGPGMRIGLNWHVRKAAGRDIAWHNGGTGGFTSFIGIDRARRTAVVLLSNSTASVDDIGFHTLERSLPLAPGPAQVKTVTLPASLLARYAGVYDLDGARVRITRLRGGLTAAVPGQGRLRLRPTGRARFALEGVAATVTFRTAARGRVAAFVLDQGGVKTVAKRVG